MSLRRVATRSADYRTRAVSILAILCLLMPCLPVLGRGIDPPSTSQPTQPESQPSDSDNYNEYDDSDIDLLELDIPMVVSATRREQKISTLPHAVSVITARDIRVAGVRNIPDALRLVAGVDVAALTCATSAVSPRGYHGFLANQVLVLVDGRQIYDAVFGGTLWGSWPFQLEDIERIEVIRGPAGVTWGPNAVNGVINVITKDPADQLGTTYIAGGGSRGAFKQYIGYAFQEDKLRMRVSGEYQADDGFKKGGSLLQDLDDDYKSGRTSLYAVYEDGPDALTFSIGNSLVDGAYPTTPTAGFGAEINAGSQASFLLAKWKHRNDEDNSYEFTAYVNDFQLTVGMRQIDYRYQQLGFQYGHTLKLHDNHTLSWGIDSRFDLVDGSSSDPGMFTKPYINTAVFGLYFQDEWRLAPRWALNVGARIDYDTYGGFGPSARAALSYQLTQQSFIYTAVSRTFHTPSSGLRLIDLPLANGLIYTTANPELKSESVIVYEFGYRTRFFDRVDVNLNLFWNEYSDNASLTMRPGPPGLVQMYLDNLVDVSLYGVELDAGWAVNKKLKLLGNYSFQFTDWRSQSSMADSDLITPPKHKFMLAALYSPTDDLHLASRLFYVDDVLAPNPANSFSPRHVDEYFRLDLSAEYEFWEDRAAFAVGVQNLLDSDHFEGSSAFINDAQVPRMLYAQLRLHFK